MPDARVAIHATLSAIVLWLGLLFASPTDTFGASHSFDFMARVATETNWGFAFIAIGVVGAAGIFTRRRILRFASVLVIATAHSVFAACLLMGNPVNSGTGTYTIVAALGYYLAWRRSVEGV